MSNRAAPPGLEYVFTIKCELDLVAKRRFGPLPDGATTTGFTPISGGTIEGPRLNGRVLPYSGADYPLTWPDGTMFFRAHYMLEATDGTVIGMKNRGVMTGPKDVLDKLARRELVSSDRYYQRLAPEFEVAAGPHDWLMRSIIVGNVDRGVAYTAFHYYRVT